MLISDMFLDAIQTEFPVINVKNACMNRWYCNFLRNAFVIHHQRIYLHSVEKHISPIISKFGWHFLR